MTSSTTQISVRLPTELLAFIDERVQQGDASSRAALIARVVRREQRRRAAERDAAVYAAIEPDGEPDSLAVWSTGRADLSRLD